MRNDFISNKISYEGKIYIVFKKNCFFVFFLINSKPTSCMLFIKMRFFTSKLSQQKQTPKDKPETHRHS